MLFISFIVFNLLTFYSRSHPLATGLRNKAFTYYDDLDYVYGNDRATGSGVENPADMVDAIDLEEQGQQTQDQPSPPYHRSF